MPLSRLFGFALLAAQVVAASGCEPKVRVIGPDGDTTGTNPPPDTGVVLVGAGDIADCTNDEDEATAALLDGIPGTVFTLGDNAYDDGTPQEFADCYGPSWGRHKDRTRPAPGNHEYNTAFAAGYFGYFGAAAGEPDKGYYSYERGGWLVVVLNSNLDMRATSAQTTWLRALLAASNHRCTLAMWHHPRFSSGVEHGSWAAPQPLWQELYEAGADIVLAGHDHLYERFAPQTPTGEADPAFGLRQFVVGTGGSSGYGFGTPAPNSEVRSSGTPGVLKLTLKRETYQWEFVPIAGAAFRDSGSGSCHGAPPAQTSSVILSAAGNIGDCGGTDDDATGRLLDDIPGTILALGDNAFDNGTLDEYQRCYGDAWGRHKARTYAVLGNHEYQLGNASGAFDYFGDRVGPRDLGYYSFDIGAWHVIVLNDNDPPVSLAGGSAQDQWLAADLASHGNLCLLAAWHAPAFLSSNSAGFTTRDRRQLWERLYSAGVDVVLNSQQHHYERMAPLRPDGTRDDATGIRQFNVGTGGESVLLPTVAIHPASEVRAARFGVLKLTLTSTGYGWDFVATGGGFVDSGSGSCH